MVARRPRRVKTQRPADLAHWVQHAVRIRQQLEEYGWDEVLGEEFAFDLTRTLGYAKAQRLASWLEPLAKNLFFDENDELREYRYGDEPGSGTGLTDLWTDNDDLLDLYMVLGWQQTVILNAWFDRTTNLRLFDDFDPPRRSHVKKPEGGYREIKVEELPHGAACPDYVPPTPVVAEATIAEPDARTGSALRAELAECRRLAAEARTRKRARR